MCACVYVCVCARMHACVCVLTDKLQVGCPDVANKELYSHCPSPPSCINGDLVIAGDANPKLSLKDPGCPCMLCSPYYRTVYDPQLQCIM